MFMSADYVLRYCQRCKIMTDHTKLECIEEVMFCCIICQEDEVLPRKLSNMEKSYIIESIHDPNHNTSKRRQVVAEVRRTSTPDKLGETETIVENMMVQYYAYGDEHYTASVSNHPSGSNINHVEAQAISAELKKIIGKG